ncbi:MAG TPA: glucosyl-3-phosphoglycerate synthase [Anaerolineales bacterium]|nr:glucosyl-3-phosphoglycerate synthase [Anaerolineales bacterium]
MNRTYQRNLFRKILIPVIHGSDFKDSLHVAGGIASTDSILLAGIVSVTEENSLSAGALPAQELRKSFRLIKSKQQIRSLELIRVTHHPWNELLKIVREEKPDLLILEAGHCQLFGYSIQEVLKNAPCNIVVACGSIPKKFDQVLIPIRGGPNAELALRLGLSLSRYGGASIHTLHIIPKTPSASRDVAFRGLQRVLNNLPEVNRQLIQTNDPTSAILLASREYELTIIGATAFSADTTVGLGAVAETILQERSKGLLIVRVFRPASTNMESEFVGQTAISILVDKWFAENTYHASEFEDLKELLALKQKQKITISLALPALNEEKTVGKVITTVKRELMERVPLLDEIVLIDSNSKDRTREIAAKHGIPVYIHQEILSQYGARAGKGEALWKSLYVTRGDIVLWIDTDIVNIHPRFLYGLLGPLLLRPDILFIKGYYRRPIKLNGKKESRGGGRVTELTARPLLNLFYPELSGVIQPLSGEYGGRRSALENMSFSSGYGVETGLLIDIFEKYGLSAIGQVDLQERVHHNQQLESLSKMSFAIIQTVVRRLERRYERNFLEDVNKTMKLIRYDKDILYLDVNEIAELERSAMVDIPEYNKNLKT